ncbi:MAG: NAD(P)-dependent alcohol dehydrogenase [Gammaproteobacteria bacterium]|nr:NAD(P)-dependent alcohol dehydrogenase [Gammaproteobacteria bacterium]
MQAFELRNKTGLGAVSLVERKDPQPGPEQVLIQMRAAALNPRDLLVLNGSLYPTLRLPLVPLSDGVGHVMAVGEKVTRVKPGDRVAGIFVQHWLSGEAPEHALSLGGEMDGVLARQVVLPQDGVVPVPTYLTDEEAATLPCAAVTAWNALMVQGNLKPGATVLIQGTGGVSLFALQFARMAGARVIVISSSDEKLERARQLGAEQTIHYKRTPDWELETLKLTDGRGVDHVVEVGGAGTLSRSINAVRAGGHISLIGILSGINTEISLRPILRKQIRIQGIYVGSRSMFEAMNRAIELHKLKPVIDRVFPFEEALDSFGYLEKANHVGKVCLRF